MALKTWLVLFLAGNTAGFIQGGDDIKESLVVQR